ncbi:hypothetical protein VFPPC_18395 [Pochonia chlamydosporia 170]|uniref:Uncharacterized protein n=1 Tax=Pochonia chlamydosporia 170 TaxID=1380566 RepID=A0A219ANR6_METCM|nr:hypothetical protein VFPPC_18395 [Pochonia chlamydosporia 170]OWT42490.1 hypothetical protein VFPPC_18395 [Pochonia chlamydosporia 170]
MPKQVTRRPRVCSRPLQMQCESNFSCSIASSAYEAFLAFASALTNRAYSHFEQVYGFTLNYQRCL